MVTQGTLVGRAKHLARRGWQRLGYRFGAMPRVLVAGTGRCGTGYVSQVLRECGLRAGHEQVYTPAGARKAWHLDVEVSWLAYPYLDRFEGRIFHVVREPLAVIRSWLELGWFAVQHTSVYKDFASQFFDFTGEEVLDAMRWYCQLNEHIGRFAEYRFRVEDPADGIAKIVVAARPARVADVSSALARVDRNINAKTRAKEHLARTPSRAASPHTFADLPEGPELHRLRAMARSYGYTCE